MNSGRLNCFSIPLKSIFMDTKNHTNKYGDYRMLFIQSKKAEELKYNSGWF